MMIYYNTWVDEIVWFIELGGSCGVRSGTAVVILVICGEQYVHTYDGNGTAPYDVLLYHLRPPNGVLHHRYPCISTYPPFVRAALPM